MSRYSGLSENYLARDNARVDTSFVHVQAPSSAPTSDITERRVALANMTALPAGLVKRPVGKKGKMAAVRPIYKNYNIVGPRPRLRKTRPMNQIQAILGVVDNLVTTSTSIPVYASFYVSLAAFAGYSQYTGCFDQYRIDELEVWVEPNTAANGTTVFSTIATCIDYDDSTNPTSIGMVEDHQYSMATNGAVGHYYRFQPHMAVAAYSGTFTSYVNEPFGWIDSNSPSVQGYGVKFAAAATPVAITYTITARAAISFRQPGIN